MLKVVQLEYIKNKVATASIFFFLYIVVYFISKNLGVANAIKTSTGIIFLPAGVRLLACLVGRTWGAIGVAIATWLVVSPDIWKDQSDTFYILIALINSSSVLIGVLIVQRALHISEDLSNLNLIHLPFIDLVATFLQAISYYYFLYFLGLIEKTKMLSHIISQMTGNFIGGMLFMLGFMVLVHINKSLGNAK